MDMTEDDRFEKSISSALEKETEFKLSPGFADRVVSMIQQQSLQKESQRDKWWLVAGIISMIGAMAYAFSTIDLKLSVGVFTFLKGYWGLVTFGVLFIICLHIIDKRLFKKQESG
jgi:hypothetical protein